MTDRFDGPGFLERVLDRRDREPYRSVDELPESQWGSLVLRVKKARPGVCPLCNQCMPVSTGARACGRCERLQPQHQPGEPT